MEVRGGGRRGREGEKERERGRGRGRRREEEKEERKREEGEMEETRISETMKCRWPRHDPAVYSLSTTSQYTSWQRVKLQYTVCSVF